MSRSARWLLALTVALVAAPACGPKPTKVMSFNVLCPICDFSYPLWWDRIDYFDDLLSRHDPDLLGTQELFFLGNVDQIDALLPEHDVVRVSRDDTGADWPELLAGSEAAQHLTEEGAAQLGALAAGSGEGASPTSPTAAGEQVLSYPDSMIFYRRDRFDVLDSGTYWLSQNPDTSFFPAWDVLSLPRIVIWARLYDKANDVELVYVNTHFDNNGGNKVPSANLFIDRAEPFADLPIIATGDFNSTPSSPSYAILVEGNDGPGGFAFTNAFDLAEKPRIDTNTDLDESYACTGKEPEEWPGCRIDHVLVGGTGTWSVTDWLSDLHQYGPTTSFPSDHRAIMAELELR